MKKKLQFLWLLLITFAVRHKKFIGMGIAGGFLGTILFLQSYPLFGKVVVGNTKKIGIVGRFNEKNLPLTIQNQLSLGLTSLLPSGEATAALALNWNIDTTEKIYIFRIRPNIFWHDGQKFTTKDVHYKIKDASFAKIDDYTLQITLKEPFAPLLTTLAQPIMRPDLVGLGLYKLGNIQYLGDNISELTLKPQIDQLPNLIYKFYSSQDDAILAFKLGEVDILQNISDPSDLSIWKNINTTQTNIYDSFVGVFFNLKDPLFKDKETRQALTYALPNFEKFTKAYTPISPLSWAYSQKVRLYRFDPETAGKILVKSPLASGSSELTITTFPNFVKLAQSIVDAWNKVGIKSKVRVTNSLPSEYQLLLVAQPIPPDPDQYPFWQSTQAVTNLTHYSNLKIDKLLEDGRKTIDREKRLKIYADFQRYIVDDAPVIFLYYPKVYTLERK